MLFRITYEDPETREELTEEVSFEDTENITAKYWAEDYAYMLADKGWYTVEELHID